MKKLDTYIIKTFFGPFAFIFSILFFIFTIQLAWSKLADFVGKGLGVGVIVKMLLLLGVQFIPLIVPLTILLAAIMAFGGFGERYELAAMKSAGISLARIMTPLFFITIILSIFLFVLADTYIPRAEKRARNLSVNVLQSKPTLSIKEGAFTDIPGYDFKIDEKYGTDGNFMKGIFIHSKASSSQNDIQTIRAERGFFSSSSDKKYLILTLYDGEYFIEQKEGKNYIEQKKQPLVSAKFDTLIQYFDVSALIEKNLDEENINTYFRFYSTTGLLNRMDTLEKEQNQSFDALTQRNLYGIGQKDSTHKDIMIKPASTNPSVWMGWQVDSLSPDKQIRIYEQALSQIQTDKSIAENNEKQILEKIKEYAKHKFKAHENLAFPITCILFFLIGAPLGSIIRKGGIGTPVVVAIIVFTIYYLLYTFSRNLAKSGSLDAGWAAWIPNLVLLPLGFWFSYLSLKDSEIYNLENYIGPIRKFVAKFTRKKEEHSRYR